MESWNVPPEIWKIQQVRNQCERESKEDSPLEYASWFPTICQPLLWFAHRPPHDPAVPKFSVVAVQTRFLLLKIRKPKSLLKFLETDEPMTAMLEAPKDHQCSVSILKSVRESRWWLMRMTSRKYLRIGHETYFQHQLLFVPLPIDV